MMTIASPTLLVIGLVLLVVGYLLTSWASRHSLTDQLKDSAWKAAISRDAGVIGRDIQGKVDEIRRPGTYYGGAKVAAGMGIRHVVAQFAGIGGIVAILIGLVVSALGIFWH